MHIWDGIETKQIWGSPFKGGQSKLKDMKKKKWARTERKGLFPGKNNCYQTGPSEEKW